ncbi:hypothetical protein [Parafrankia sp. FMc2]|uniref:hypothetical protein n=1 Tax=Parafrankia sp. FMc2 TaxID=3233196 RepID=UPI0034D53570
MTATPASDAAATELAALERKTEEHRAWLARETCPHTRRIIRDELAALRRAKADLRPDNP